MDFHLSTHRTAVTKFGQTVRCLIGGLQRAAYVRQSVDQVGFALALAEHAVRNAPILPPTAWTPNVSSGGRLANQLWIFQQAN